MGCSLVKVYGGHRERVNVKKGDAGTVSTGNLILCQTAQAKADE